METMEAKLSFEQESPLIPAELCDCPVCFEQVPETFLAALINCQHRFCILCLKKHITLSIHENRIEVSCPGCSADVHPDDVKSYCSPNTNLYAKYEQFSIRAALLKMTDATWCPAPDCGFVVIVPNGARCPRIRCQRPECGIEFCFLCKKPWHPSRPCEKTQPVESGRADRRAAIRGCPRCRTPILKADDGSCNHMQCTMCGAEFCWLCLKQVTDFHYMSPTGCTFWGSKPWSRKKRLFWQIGSLVGSPLVIAATAVISVPLIIGFVPFSVGRWVFKRLRTRSSTQRIVLTTVAVVGSALAAPALASMAVVVGVPFALGYTYIMVPRALLQDVLDYLKRDLHPVDVVSHV